LKALFEQQGQQWAADMITVLIDIKTAVEKSKSEGQRSIPTTLLRELEDRCHWSSENVCFSII
jgi:hypothetical protein